MPKVCGLGRFKTNDRIGEARPGNYKINKAVLASKSGGQTQVYSNMQTSDVKHTIDSELMNRKCFIVYNYVISKTEVN